MDKTETSKENLEYTILKQNLVEAVWQIFYLEDLLARHNISFGNKAFQEFKAKNPLKQAEVMQKIKNALANGNASSSSQSQGNAASTVSSAKISPSKSQDNSTSLHSQTSLTRSESTSINSGCCQDPSKIDSALTKVKSESSKATSTSDVLKSREVVQDSYALLLSNHIEDQASLIKRIQITQSEIDLFKSCFKGREDVFSLRSGKPNSKTLKYCYYPVCDTYWKRNCPRLNKTKDEASSVFVGDRDNDTTCQTKKVKSLACKDCPVRDFVKLTDPFIKNHIAGFKDDCSDVIGLYVSTENSKCYFLVFDFDNHFISDYGSVEDSLLDNNYNQQLQEATYLKRTNSLNQNVVSDASSQDLDGTQEQHSCDQGNKSHAEKATNTLSSITSTNVNRTNSNNLSLDKRLVTEVLSLCKVCKQESIDYLLERSRSGSGYHLWIFFNEALDLKLVRHFGSLLLSVGASNLGLSTFRTFDRMIPTQDYVPKGGFGNLIALPLQGRALLKGNSAFVDDNLNAYKDQFTRLDKVHKHDLNFVQNKIHQWSSILINQVGQCNGNNNVGLNQASVANVTVPADNSNGSTANCGKDLTKGFCNKDFNINTEFSLEIENLIEAEDGCASSKDGIYTKENFLDYLVKGNRNPLSKLVDITAFDNGLSKKVLTCFNQSDVLPIRVTLKNELTNQQNRQNSNLVDSILERNKDSKEQDGAELSNNAESRFNKASHDELSKNSSYQNLLSKFEDFNFDDLKTPCVYIIFSNSVAIFKRNLKQNLITQLKALCSYQNALFYKYQSKGFQNLLRNEPRIVQCFYEDHDFIYLPRGLYQVIIDGFNASNIKCLVKDLRYKGATLDAVFTGKLKDEQQKAVESVLGNDYGIINAATGFGKTVVATFLIHKFKVNTLIVVHKKELAQQWIEKLNKFLTFNMLLPNYQTKSGKNKQRQTHIGHLWSNSNTLSHLVDVALVQSLFSNGRLNTELLNNYGMVIFDECHHSAATSYYSVLSYINSKRVYGFSATIKRDDRQEKKFLYQLGPVLYSYSAMLKSLESNLPHFVFIRFTPFISKNCESNNYNLLFEELINCEKRNRKIIADVKECILNQRTPLVLTNRVEHAKALAKALTNGNVAKHIVLILGNTSNKETQQRRQYLESIPDNESLVVVATGQCVGEGFDYPRLDTLMLTCPIKNNVNVEQYVGRISREYPNKKDIIVYDYLDMQVGIFCHMFEHRKRTYKRIGYEIISHESQNRALLQAFEPSVASELDDNTNLSDGSNSQTSRSNSDTDAGGATLGDNKNGLSSELEDKSLQNSKDCFENISFRKQKGMYSDLEYQEIFKQDFYNAQEEIIVFASSMDEKLVKDFSLNVQKLIELGVRVVVVTCNNALQKRNDATLKERDFDDELEFCSENLSEEFSITIDDNITCKGGFNSVLNSHTEDSRSIKYRKKNSLYKSKSSAYLDNVVSTLRQVGIEVSVRAYFPQSFVIVDKKLAWFALNPLDKVEKNSIFIRIDSPLDVQDLLEIAYQI